MTPREAAALDRWITRAPCDAERDDHAPCAKCRGLSSVIAADGLCPDCETTDDDAELAADPAFVTVCDARRDAWLAAHETAAEEPAALPWQLAWCSADETATLGVSL